MYISAAFLPQQLTKLQSHDEGAESSDTDTVLDTPHPDGRDESMFAQDEHNSSNSNNSSTDDTHSSSSNSNNAANAKAEHRDVLTIAGAVLAGIALIAALLLIYRHRSVTQQALHCTHS